MALNIESISDQAGKPAILLREAWREGKRVRRRTIANLPELPLAVGGGFRAVLKGAVAVTDIGDLLDVERSLPHGHAAAVLGTARDPGLDRILHRTAGRERRLALATIVSRVISPDSRPATARRLLPETATDSLGALPGLGPVTGNGIPGMPGWLPSRQPSSSARTGAGMTGPPRTLRQRGAPRRARQACANRNGGDRPACPAI